MGCSRSMIIAYSVIAILAIALIIVSVVQCTGKSSSNPYSNPHAHAAAMAAQARHRQGCYNAGPDLYPQRKFPSASSYKTQEQYEDEDEKCEDDYDAAMDKYDDDMIKYYNSPKYLAWLE